MLLGAEGAVDSRDEAGETAGAGPGSGEEAAADAVPAGVE